MVQEVQVGGKDGVTEAKGFKGFKGFKGDGTGEAAAERGPPNLLPGRRGRDEARPSQSFRAGQLL